MKLNSTVDKNGPLIIFQVMYANLSVLHEVAVLRRKEVLHLHLDWPFYEI